MKSIREGEVWKVRFPLEEDESRFLTRPVVVLDVDVFEVLSVKVTKHAPRANHVYDTPIIYWEKAKLRCQSTARIGKTRVIPKEQFIDKHGDLHIDDFNNIKDQFTKFIGEISE